MPTLAPFTFEYFQASMPYETSTFAYWPVGIRDLAAFEALPIEKLWLKLSSQYDGEDQASVGDDDVWGCPELQSIIRLFAPVQLTRKWSALPEFSHWLGEPDVVRSSTRSPATVAACWRTPRLAAESLGPGRGQRAWRERVGEIARLAAARPESFAVVGYPGFSYDHRELTPVVRRALKRGGFEIVTRAP